MERAHDRGDLRGPAPLRLLHKRALGGQNRICARECIEILRLIYARADDHRGGPPFGGQGGRSQPLPERKSGRHREPSIEAAGRLNDGVAVAMVIVVAMAVAPPTTAQNFTDAEMARQAQAQ
jgi:hypothetical protein